PCTQETKIVARRTVSKFCFSTNFCSQETELYAWYQELWPSEGNYSQMPDCIRGDMNPTEVGYFLLAKHPVLLDGKLDWLANYNVDGRTFHQLTAEGLAILAAQCSLSDDELQAVLQYQN